MNGIFIISQLTGPVAEQIHAVHRACDPRLAGSSAPHVTLAGSSGVGPIPLGTPLGEINAALEPIARTTAPIPVRFGAPMRFMQTDIVVLPMDPHGPLRTLHERIARSGLQFESSRFPFTPHVTLSFYPTLTAELKRKLFAVRVAGSIEIDRIQLYRTVDPMPGKRVGELELSRGRPANSE
jgi:2'-5' RNA ligase